jgi:hypothetical protein
MRRTSHDSADEEISLPAPINLRLTSVTWARWESITLAQTATDLVAQLGSNQ